MEFNNLTYIWNMDKDYRVVTKFNKMNMIFTLRMRRHLKSHPFNYLIYHEDDRGYSKFILIMPLL